MTEFFTITLLIMLAAISPGPDFAMVIKNALLHDRNAGIFTALGVFCSLIIHASYCIFGLAIIISKSLLLFSIIKYLGAAYLIYIGIKSLFTKQLVTKINDQAAIGSITVRQAFLQGLFCNLLNPKSILFAVAFFTLIIKPSTSLEIQIGFGMEIAIIHFIWFTCLALMITHQSVKRNLNKIQHYIVKVMGVVLIGFGARVALISQVLR